MSETECDICGEMDYCNSVAHEAYLWKSLAEKLAEALKPIAFFEGSTGTKKDMWRLSALMIDAQQALSDFEKAKGT